jgi:hypothetical protein
MLTPDQQLALDAAYWHTTRTITDIRTEFGLTVHQLNSSITPLPTGTSCWWCRTPLTYKNRRARSDERSRWYRMTCVCGAEQPAVPQRDDLVPTDAAIIAPRFERRRWVGYSRDASRSGSEHELVHSASEVVCLGVEALERAGLRWNGEFHVVEAHDSPDAVLARLERLPTRVLVVPSITDTMQNEGDALALFFRLVARGWRVMSAARSHLGHDVYEGWCDDLAQPWQRGSGASLRLVASEQW